MKAVIAVCGLLILSLSCMTAVFCVSENLADTWVSTAPMPKEMAGGEFEAVALNGAVFVFGKIIVNQSDYQPIMGNYQYDPESDTWTVRSPPPTYRTGATAVVYQEKIYRIGGWPVQMDMEIYDPETDTWEIGGLTYWPRIYAQANVVGDKIYVIGGGQMVNIREGVENVDVNFAYDPANDSWSEMAPIPTAVRGYASAVFDGKIYIMGGVAREGAGSVIIDLVQIYDPQTNGWSVGASMPVGVCFADAEATSGVFAPERIYVVGGEVLLDSFDEHARVNLTQVYDPKMDSWSFGASMQNKRAFLQVSNIDDVLYVVGESDVLPSNKTEKYIPLGYEFSTSPTQNPTASPNQSTDLSPTQQPTTPPSNSGTPGTSFETPPGLNENYGIYYVILTIAAIIVVGLLLVVKLYLKNKKPNG